MAGGAGARLVWPRPQPVDMAGVPLVGGKLWTYATGTDTPLATYSDPDLTVPNTNPILCDAAGLLGDIFLLPASYRIVLLDANDAQVWLADPVGTAITVTAGVPVGGMMPYGGAAAPTGWLLCYGQAVSRTTYALLFAAIGTAYGVGNGTTTFNVPDRRGRGSIGKDNMGGVPANRVTVGGSGIAGDTLGAAGGDQLAQQHLHVATGVPHTHDVNDPEHAHGPPNSAGNTGLLYWDTVTGPGHFLPGAFLPTGLNRGNTSSSATGITIADTTADTTIANALFGMSQNMPPVITDNWIIFAGA